MSETQSGYVPWWGRFKLGLDQLASWRIGPLRLSILRGPGEWRIATAREPQPLDNTLEYTPPTPSDRDLMLMEEMDITRFASPASSEVILLRPMLADRSLVSRPETPFCLPMEESVEIYVSAPIWMRIATERPPRQLTEFPIFRPSDTWFGPDTRTGALCYASRTYPRLDLGDLPIRPHRATTAITIKNRATTPLQLERMNLPVPHLSLFHGPDGRLWTEDITLEHTARDELASLTIHDGAPSRAPNATLLEGPRVRASNNLVFRAFATLFKQS